MRAAEAMPFSVVKGETPRLSPVPAENVTWPVIRPAPTLSPSALTTARNVIEFWSVAGAGVTVSSVLVSVRRAEAFSAPARAGA